jgi:hypothetical protein
MNYEVPKSTFYRSLMTGLFVGIVDTLLCLLFNLFFRESTHFLPTSIVNVASLIFFINLLFPLIGIVYNFFLRSFKKGDVLFAIVFIVLTVLCVWGISLVQRSNNPTENSEFHTLALVIALVLGLSAAFLLPFLYHNRKFEEYVV